MKIEESCRNCKRTYVTHWPEGYQEFCCLGCRVEFYHKEEVCLWCGSDFDKIAGSHNRYCSLVCQYSAEHEDVE